MRHVFFGTEFWPHVVYVEDLSFYFIRMNSTSSNYGIINPSRSPWKLKYNSLRDVQKIIHIEKSRDGKIGVGWIPGWCTFWPGGKVTLDLQSETLVTKISFCQASSNCNARASKIEFSCSNSLLEPFKPIYNLIPTQPNRRQLAIPPGENFDSCSSFYLFGHAFNNVSPEPWTKLGNSDIDDLHTWTLCNHGQIERITLDGSTTAAARYWQFHFPETNGSFYIGINNLDMFGNPNPLPAPQEVSVSVVKVDGEDCFRVSWRFNAIAFGFKVVSFSSRFTMGAGGYEHICGPSTFSLDIVGLFKSVFYCFVVYALDESGNVGVPSSATSPISLSIENERELVSLRMDLQETFELKFNVGNALLGNTAAVENLMTVTWVSSPDVNLQNLSEVSKKRLVEQAALKELLQRIHKNFLNVEDYSEESPDQSRSKLIAGHFDFASYVNNAAAENVTVFISSTFADTSVERNYMMEHAFPILTDYCRARGLTFSAVDLRW